MTQQNFRQVDTNWVLSKGGTPFKVYLVNSKSPIDDVHLRIEGKKLPKIKEFSRLTLYSVGRVGELFWRRMVFNIECQVLGCNKVIPAYRLTSVEGKIGYFKDFLSESEMFFTTK